MHFAALYIEMLSLSHAPPPNPGLVPSDVFTGGPSARAQGDSTEQGAATFCKTN